MAIFRARRKTNFTMISNVGLKDKTLSFKAKGLLAYMLSLPDDWVFYESEIVKHSTDGKQSVRTGLKELEKAGYLVKHQSRSDAGKFSNIDWIVSDEPNVEGITFPPSTEKPSTVNPSTVKPSTDKPSTDNRTLLSTNITKDLSIPSTNNTKSRNSAKAKYDDDSPYLKLSHRLFDHIKQRNPEHKQPNFQSWADDIRKTVELDNRNIDNLTNVLDWSQLNDFWQSNILSAKKLREKYDTLTMQMMRDKPKIISHNFSQEAPQNDSAYQYTQDEIDEYEKATGKKWEG